jgi:hypothetical protein
VVLDPKRILTDQVARELLDRGGRRFEIPPSARLADPGDPGVGLHFGVQIAFQQMNVHAGYLERHSFTPPDANPSTKESLRESECHHHRKGDDNATCHEHGLGGSIEIAELTDAQRHRPQLASVHQDQEREQELVPDRDEDVDGDCGDRRHRERNRDQPDDLKAARTVDARGVIDLLRYALQVVPQDEQG